MDMGSLGLTTGSDAVPGDGMATAGRPLHDSVGHWGASMAQIAAAVGLMGRPRDTVKNVESRMFSRVWDNTRSLQRDEAMPTGEAQPPPAADSSDPSAWDVETATVHQDVEDINDGREMGILSSNTSNNVSPAASSGPISNGPGQPGPSSSVSDSDPSDDAYSPSYSSSPSSAPRSEDMVIATIEPLLKTNPSKCTHTEVGKDIMVLAEALINSHVILAFDFSDTRRVGQEPSSGNLNLHTSTGGESYTIEDAVTVITQLFCKSVQCFGYGDVTTRDHVFSFFHDQRHCNGIEEILRSLQIFAQHVQKGPSTSLVPIIRTAMDTVDSSGGRHHILVIFTEHLDQVEEDPVVHASFYALSIVVVAVGDGPWIKNIQHSIGNLPLPCDCCICKEDVIKDPVIFNCNHTLCMNCLEGMYEVYGRGEHPCPQCRKPLQGYRSESSRRRFLNFHLVNFNELMQMDLPKKTKDALFLLKCFENTPTQLNHIQYLGILGSTTGMEQHSKPLGPPLGCHPDFVSWDVCYQDLPGSSKLWPGLDP